LADVDRIATDDLRLRLAGARDGAGEKEQQHCYACDHSTPLEATLARVHGRLGVTARFFHSGSMDAPAPPGAKVSAGEDNFGAGCGIDRTRCTLRAVRCPPATARGLDA